MTTIEVFSLSMVILIGMSILFFEKILRK